MLTVTLDCPPHLSSPQQLGVSMCPAASHAAALLTPRRRSDLDLTKHSESLESHRSRLDCSAPQIFLGTLPCAAMPCCFKSDFVMYLLLLLAIGDSTASPLGFQGTPMNVMSRHCLSLVRLRNERTNSIPNAVPTMTSSLSSVRPRNVPVAQRGSSFAISPRTILKSTVHPPAPVGCHIPCPSDGPTHCDHHLASQID